MEASTGAVIATTLFSPSLAAKKFFDDEPFIAGLCSFILAAFSCAVTQLLIFRAAAGYESSPAFVVWIFMANVLSGCMVIVAGLCLISFFLLLLGGKVNPGSTIWSLTLCFAPWMFSVFPAVMATAIGGALGIAVTIPCFTVLFFWAVIILVSMVSVAAETDLLRAALAVVMSFATAVVLFWAGAFTFCISSMNLLVSLSPPA